ncbi:MAG TPA: cation:proton antiporter [Alphaproteobacteria bacterium]|nr:cation:proton antiporter [Alphaproteobacteria bacterium]
MFDLKLLEQLAYLGIIILIGCIVLSLRRRALGNRTGYKLTLVLLGILLGMITIGNSTLPILSFSQNFMEDLAVFLLVVLLFELSVRLNHENIVINYTTVSMFIAILVVNVVILGVLSSYIIPISPVHGAVLAIILSSIEYFLVGELKKEGDLANPLILLFAFSIMVFYGLEGNVFSNIVYLLKYIFIGLAVGVLGGIITFRILRYRQASIANELGMIFVAVTTYAVTDQLGGSGLFAILILGVFFGNSYVRKTSNMHSFSPFIFKTLEMLIFILIGFVATIHFDEGLWYKALAIFGAYLFLRLLIINYYYRYYSLQNKLLLALAPKGMILGVMILVLGAFTSIPDSLLTVMLFILLYSLLLGIAVEYVEQERIIKLPKRKFKVVDGRLFRLREDKENF